MVCFGDDMLYDVYFVVVVGECYFWFVLVFGW